MSIADGESWERENGPPAPRAMSDAQHANRIKDLAHELTKAINAASDAGLDVDVDAQTIRMQSMNNAKAVPVWTIHATVARPL